MDGSDFLKAASTGSPQVERVGTPSISRAAVQANGTPLGKTLAQSILKLLRIIKVTSYLLVSGKARAF